METKSEINNEIYNILGERWYIAYDNPVALLRQESKIKIPWVLNKIEKQHSKNQHLKILDVGCGAGFLSNRLAQESFEVHGIDLSEESLHVAQKYDSTEKVHYQKADAYNLPYLEDDFDIVLAMDFLEHVENPEQVVKEISRVLKPGGMFFFHTFNRNFLAYVVIIKLVELLVKNTPKNMHVAELFIKPSELSQFCQNHQMKIEDMIGIRPVLSSITFKSLLTGHVPVDFSFTLTKSLMLSYMGYAFKADSFQL